MCTLCFASLSSLILSYTTVSHLQVLTIVVKPMATLIITRRLYLIVSMQTIEIPSQAAVCILDSNVLEAQRAELSSEKSRINTRMDVGRGDPFVSCRAPL